MAATTIVLLNRVQKKKRESKLPVLTSLQWIHSIAKFTFLYLSLWHSLDTPSTKSMQNPRLGKYSTRSAITNPTLKNKLEAGRNGTIINARLIVSSLCEVVDKPIISSIVGGFQDMVGWRQWR